MIRGSILLPVFLLFVCETATAQVPNRSTVLIDTDLGTDIDDAFALGLALASPELEIRGITTVGAETQQRALMLCRFLTVTGRRHTAVAAGNNPQPERRIVEQYQYYYHPDVLFDRTKKPERESAVDFLAARIQPPNAVTLVALGPLTNVAQLLAAKPDSLKQVARIIAVESNFKHDIAAARKVMSAGLPLVVLTEEACRDLRLDQRQTAAVFSGGGSLSRQIQALYQLWGRRNPPLADALAVWLCIDERFVTTETKSLRIADDGALHDVAGAATITLVTAVKSEEFRNRYTSRMESLVPPARNPVKLVQQGGMPHRVHRERRFRNRHRAPVVDERQARNVSRSGGEQARLPKRADARF